MIATKLVLNNICCCGVCKLADVLNKACLCFSKQKENEINHIHCFLKNNYELPPESMMKKKKKKKKKID